MNATQVALLGALLRMNGSCVDKPGGRATSVLLAASGIAVSRETAAQNLLIMEQNDLIIRDMAGKRTYEIALGEVPDEWRIAAEKTLVARALPEPRVQVAEMPAPPPATSDVDPIAVADALLARCLEVANGPQQTKVDARRLADVLEENGRLRAKCSRLEATVADLTEQMTAQRRKCSTLEANLQRALSDNRRVIEPAITQGIARFMSERPEPGILTRTGSDR